MEKVRLAIINDQKPYGYKYKITVRLALKNSDETELVSVSQVLALTKN
jgi:hypothetical protein